MMTRSSRSRSLPLLNFSSSRTPLFLLMVVVLWMTSSWQPPTFLSNRQPLALQENIKKNDDYSDASSSKFGGGSFHFFAVEAAVTTHLINNQQFSRDLKLVLTAENNTESHFIEVVDCHFTEGATLAVEGDELRGATIKIHQNIFDLGNSHAAYSTREDSRKKTYYGGIFLQMKNFHSAELKGTAPTSKQRADVTSKFVVRGNYLENVGIVIAKTNFGVAQFQNSTAPGIGVEILENNCTITQRGVQCIHVEGSLFDRLSFVKVAHNSLLTQALLKYVGFPFAIQIRATHFRNFSSLSIQDNEDINVIVLEKSAELENRLFQQAEYNGKGDLISPPSTLSPTPVSDAAHVPVILEAIMLISVQFSLGGQVRINNNKISGRNDGVGKQAQAILFEQIRTSNLWMTDSGDLPFNSKILSASEQGRYEKLPSNARINVGGNKFFLRAENDLASGVGILISKSILNDTAISIFDNSFTIDSGRNAMAMWLLYTKLFRTYILQRGNIFSLQTKYESNYPLTQALVWRIVCERNDQHGYISHSHLRLVYSNAFLNSSFKTALVDMNLCELKNSEFHVLDNNVTLQRYAKFHNTSETGSPMHCAIFLQRLDIVQSWMEIQSMQVQLDYLPTEQQISIIGIASEFNNYINSTMEIRLCTMNFTFMVRPYLSAQIGGMRGIRFRQDDFEHSTLRLIGNDILLKILRHQHAASSTAYDLVDGILLTQIGTHPTNSPLGIKNCLLDFRNNKVSVSGAGQKSSSALHFSYVKITQATFAADHNLWYAESSVVSNAAVNLFRTNFSKMTMKFVADEFVSQFNTSKLVTGGWGLFFWNSYLTQSSLILVSCRFTVEVSMGATSSRHIFGVGGGGVMTALERTSKHFADTHTWLRCNQYFLQGEEVDRDTYKMEGLTNESQSILTCRQDCLWFVDCNPANSVNVTPHVPCICECKKGFGGQRCKGARDTRTFSPTKSLTVSNLPKGAETVTNTLHHVAFTSSMITSALPSASSTIIAAANSFSSRTETHPFLGEEEEIRSSTVTNNDVKTTSTTTLEFESLASVTQTQPPLEQLPTTNAAPTTLPLTTSPAPRTAPPKKRPPRKEETGVSVAMQSVMQPQQAQAVVASTATVTAAGSMMTAPAAAGGIVRTGLVTGGAECAFADTSLEPALMELPLQISLGDGKFRTYVGSVLLVTGLLIVMPTAAIYMALYHLTEDKKMDNNNKRKNRSSEEVEMMGRSSPFLNPRDDEDVHHHALFGTSGEDEDITRNNNKKKQKSYFFRKGYQFLIGPLVGISFAYFPPILTKSIVIVMLHDPTTLEAIFSLTCFLLLCCCMGVLLFPILSFRFGDNVVIYTSWSESTEDEEKGDKEEKELKNSGAREKLNFENRADQLNFSEDGRLDACGRTRTLETLKRERQKAKQKEEGVKHEGRNSSTTSKENNRRGQDDDNDDSGGNFVNVHQWEFEVDAETMHRWMQCPCSYYFVEAMGPVFDACRDPISLPIRLYFFEELGIGCLLGVVDGIRPEEGNCIPIATLMLIISALHLLYALIYRPFRTRLEAFFFTLNALMLVVLACFSILVVVNSSSSSSETYEKGLGLTALIVNIFFLIQSLVMAIWVVLKFIRNKKREIKAKNDEKRGRAKMEEEPQKDDGDDAMRRMGRQEKPLLSSTYYPFRRGPDDAEESPHVRQAKQQLLLNYKQQRQDGQAEGILNVVPEIATGTMNTSADQLLGYNPLLDIH